MRKWRTAQAFFLAPFVVPFVLLLPLPNKGNFGHFSFGALFGDFFLYLLFSLPIAYASELLLGLPAWTLFNIMVSVPLPRTRPLARSLAG
jgi:hypothetical protein